MSASRTTPDATKQFASTAANTSSAADGLSKLLSAANVPKAYVGNLENARKILRTHSQMAYDLRKMNRAVLGLEKALRNTATGADKIVNKLDQARKAYFAAKAEFEANRLTASLAHRVFRDFHGVREFRVLTNAKMEKLGSTISKFTNSLQQTKSGRHLLKTGKVLSSKKFIFGALAAAAALDAVVAYHNSPTHTTAGKVTNATLAGGGTVLVNTNLYVALGDLALPKGFKLSELFHGTADVLSSYGEAFVNDDLRALDTFHKRSMNGSYGKVLQASSEAGEYWNKHGLIGGLKPFVETVKWWVSQD